MLKISSKGLEEYKDDYYNKIEEKIKFKLKKITFKNNNSYKGQSLKEYLDNNLETILIGNIYSLREVKDIIEQNFLKRDSVIYLICQYLYTTKATSKDYIIKKIKQIIKKSNESSTDDNNNKDIEKLLQNIKKYNNGDWKQFVKNNYEDINNVLEDIKTLKKIFNYDNLYTKERRHTILNKIGVNVCPYCGRQFVSNYDDKSSAELDHFYSKDKYPYLALSLFNFVPSCHLCNSILKKNHDFFEEEHLYPYIEGFEEKARFDIDNSVLITDIINGSADAKLIIDYDEKNTKIKNNINTFKLESVYQNHSKDVRELFKLIQIYNSSYLESIAKTLLDDKPSDQMLAQKAIELMNIVFKEKGNDEILSKLHNDILNKYWRHDLD